MPSLEIVNLCKRYKEFTLDSINLQIESGTVCGLIGANGAGKTTLFRCIMGTIRKSLGTIKIDGQIIDDASGRWRQSIGYVGDDTPLFENWSGARNLKKLSAFYENWSQDTVESLAAKFGLDLEKEVKSYSTGQRTKFSIIHALAHGASFLLLDEPTSGLDPVARDTFMEILYDQMQQEEITILYATHYVSEIEQLADQLIFMNGGRIISHEMKEDLIDCWRKITFSSDKTLGDIPNQVSIKKYGIDYEITTNNYESTLMFLEQFGAKSIQATRLSVEQICVHKLKSEAKYRGLQN